MKIFILLCSFICFNSAYGIEKKSFLIVNFFEESGLLYSMNTQTNDAFPTFSFDFDKTKPIIKRLKPNSWGVTLTLHDSIKKTILSSVEDEEISYEKVDIIPNNKKIYAELSMDEIREVLPGFPTRHNNFDGLSEKSLEKLSLYGNRLNADIVVAIYPAKGHFGLKKLSYNRILVATPPGMAFVYFANKIFATVSHRTVLIDPKTKKTLESKAGSGSIEIKFPSRVLTTKEQDRLFKAMGEKINMDFSKPLTDTEIKKLKEKYEDGGEYDPEDLDPVFFPLHHRFNQFEKQSESIIDIMRQHLNIAAVRSAEFSDTLYLLKSRFSRN